MAALQAAANGLDMARSELCRRLSEQAAGLAVAVTAEVLGQRADEQTPADVVRRALDVLPEGTTAATLKLSPEVAKHAIDGRPPAVGDRHRRPDPLPRRRAGGAPRPRHRPAGRPCRRASPGGTAMSPLDTVVLDRAPRGGSHPSSTPSAWSTTLAAVATSPGRCRLAGRGPHRAEPPAQRACRSASPSVHAGGPAMSPLDTGVLERARDAARPARLGRVSELLGLQLRVTGLQAAVGDLLSVESARPRAGRGRGQRPGRPGLPAARLDRRTDHRRAGARSRRPPDHRRRRGAPRPRARRTRAPHRRRSRRSTGSPA